MPVKDYGVMAVDVQCFTPLEDVFRVKLSAHYKDFILKLQALELSLQMLV